MVTAANKQKKFISETEKYTVIKHTNDKARPLLIAIIGFTMI
jgi:hypothetical protein